MAYSINSSLEKELLLSDPDESDSSTGSQKHLNNKTPTDRYLICFLIFYLFGITSVIPWNFFITAEDYWMYKFRDVQNSSIKLTMITNRTTLQKEFSSYICMASTIPNTIFLILSTMINNRITFYVRMVISLAVILLLFTVTTVFVQVNTDNMETMFFIITVGIVILLNIFSAIFTSSIYGSVVNFSPKYTTALVNGQGISGIFAAVTQIFALALGESPTHTAVIYFSLGTISCLLSLVGFFVLIKSQFYIFHLSNQQENHSRRNQVSYMAVFKKIWMHNVSILLTFAFTLATYPGVVTLIESQYKFNGSEWSNRYFSPVICYLLFCICDSTGRIMAGHFKWFSKTPKIIFFLCIARVVFIPLFMFCNAQPRTYLPVIFTQDWEYIIILICCSLTNGYLANLVFLSGPNFVDEHEKEVASTILCGFLGIGLSIGSLANLPLIKLL